MLTYALTNVNKWNLIVEHITLRGQRLQSYVAKIMAKSVQSVFSLKQEETVNVWLTLGEGQEESRQDCRDGGRQSHDWAHTKQYSQGEKLAQQSEHWGSHLACKVIELLHNAKITQKREVRTVGSEI